MFVDEEWQKDGGDYPRGDNGGDTKRTALIFLGFSLLLLIFILVVFLAIRLFMGKEPAPKEESQRPTSTLTHSLPKGGDDKGNQESTSTPIGSKAEAFQFGDFYEEPETEEFRGFPDYELPVNSKIDVSNYYDIDRKLNISDKVGFLDENGFLIIENPYDGKDDFYALYKELKNRDIPVLVTSDFLNYYYQNILKASFRKIESDIFYETLWEVCEEMYLKSKRRYDDLLAREGITSDPFLEAARLEASYFAVALKLLEPKEDQIGKTEFNKEDKFTSSEATGFSISLPYYLREDVPGEVDLILNYDDYEEEANISPVFRYRKDYGVFEVPEIYKDSGRLNNFYLASRWLNSIFPLFYRSEECPACLTDKPDWVRNTLASLLIAGDFEDLQRLENEWAKIYKILAFFNGLREELTYMDYNNSLERVLGESHDMEDIFWGEDLATTTGILADIQKDIKNNSDFTSLEGSYSYNETSSRPMIGMRLLSDPYSPAEQIYSELSYPNVTSYTGFGKSRDNIVSCKAGGVYSRCRAVGMDIMNLFHDGVIYDDFFLENTTYRGYEERVLEVKDQIKRFNDYTWHKDNFWSEMYMFDKSFNRESSSTMPFERSDDWVEREKALFLGALVDIHSEGDELKARQKEQNVLGGGVVSGNFAKKYSYVEPNMTLIKEWKANMGMILDFFKVLRIDRYANIKDSLKRGMENFDGLEDITRKQLTGEKLTEENIEFLEGFVQRYEVSKSGNKSIKFPHSNTQEIDGLKVLLVIYEKNDKKVIVAGPIYNYQEN